MNSEDKRVYGSLALFSAIFFSLTLITVHVVEMDANFGAVSLYSLGPFGLVMRIGFIWLGLAFLFLSLGLWDRTRHRGLYYPDEGLLLISAMGLALIGIFNTDPPGASSTLTGIVHSWSALTWSFSASFGMLIFAPSFRRDGISLNVRRLSRNLGIIALAVWSTGFLSYGTFFAPIQPRLFFSIVFVWVLLIAVQLHSGKLAT